MPKYCVRYYKTETNIVRYDIVVEADSPQAARQRVVNCFTGKEEFTDEEWATENSGSEFVDTSEFRELAEEDEPFAVMEVVG